MFYVVYMHGHAERPTRLCTIIIFSKFHPTYNNNTFVYAASYMLSISSLVQPDRWTEPRAKGSGAV